MTDLAPLPYDFMSALPSFELCAMTSPTAR